MANRIGQQFGNYRLIRLLGKGGVAEVYLGEHIHLETPAAIKVLHTRLASDDVEQFRAEARTVAHLAHPHIVRILDFGVEKGTPFLVMEYAPHGTMRKRCPKDSRLPLEMIVAYVKQVADALYYIHEQKKLVHRDVKPENMLLRTEYDLLLSDFGIVVAAHTTGSLILEGLIGTLPYMAPEQFEGKPRPASDQYALGITVYQWLCGKRPFDGLTGSIKDHHLHTPPPALHQQLPTISPAVESVVLKALSKNPKERFASVQAFAAALEQAFQEQEQPHSIPPFQEPASHALLAAPTSPPSLPAITTNSSSQSPQLPMEASSAMKSPEQTKETVPGGPPVRTEEILPVPSEQKEISMIPAPAGQTFQQENAPVMHRRQRPTQRRLSRRTMIRGLGVAGLALVGGGITWFVTSHAVPHHTTTIPPRKPSPTPTATPIPLGTILSSYSGHGDVSVTAVAWSPNGRYIASASLASTVQVSNAATGGHVYTYRGHSGYLYTVAWSPDGRRIASGGDDKTVQVWDAIDGGHVYTYRGHFGNVNTVAWSPDGTWIASGAGTDLAAAAAPSSDHTVQIWNATTGNIRFSYRTHAAGVNVIAWSPNSKWIASGSDDKTVQVWDANGSHVYTYRGHTNAVVTLAWSPDSERIISSDHKTIQAWNAIDGAHPHIYGGDVSSASWLAWSPNGQRIASCDVNTSPPQAVQLWDAADGGHPYAFSWQNGGSIFEVAWSPEGRRIALVGNGPVLVWVAG